MQQNIVLNKRYAKALLALAGENNVLERSYADMKTIHRVFAQNKELSALLKSPVIRLSKKQNIIDRLFDRSIHPLIQNYVRIILRKQRGFMLEGIALAYLDEYKKLHGIEKILLITAFPMDDQIRQQAVIAAKRLTDCDVEFEHKINPDIIGGFILRLGEKQYNASVKHRLSLLRKHMNL